MEIGSEKVKIIETICTKWKKIGEILDFDDLGSKVSIIDTQTNNVENHLTEVLKLWLHGESRAYTPASWRTFIQLLNDCEYRCLAATLEEQFQ